MRDIEKSTLFEKFLREFVANKLILTFKIDNRSGIGIIRYEQCHSISFHSIHCGKLWERLLTIDNLCIDNNVFDIFTLKVSKI